MTIKINVHRLIFRADYPVNFEILDRPGTIMATMAKTVPDYLGEFGTSRADPHAIRANNDLPKEGISRQFNVEPNNINATVEVLHGLPLHKIRESAEFRALSSILEALTQKTAMDKIVRFGLRILAFASVEGKESGSALPQAKTLINDDLLSFFDQDAGTISDIGLTIQGKKDNVFEYRATFGPFFTTDLTKFMARYGSEATPEICGNPYMTFDLDIWQSEFSFKGMTLDGWARHKLAALETMISGVTTRVSRTSGK